jgi:hypothetical protein
MTARLGFGHAALVAALLAVGSGSAEGGSCNYGCELAPGGCFTCQVGSDLVDCNVTCPPGGSTCWGQACFAREAREGESLPAIQRIHPIQDEVLQILDPPYRQILTEVVPRYNSERSEKRSSIQIRGAVLVEGEDHPSDFTLTVEEDPGGIQILSIEVETTGAAELTLDPRARQVSFLLSYNDGRRPISGRGALAP